jgi:ABC-type sugar transport system substrate-binding protein
MKKSAWSLLLFVALISAEAVIAQDAKEHKIGALTKSLANPYFLRMKEGYDRAREKLGVELVFGSTPKEEADVEQLNILQSWVTEGSPADILERGSDDGEPEGPSHRQY